MTAKYEIEVTPVGITAYETLKRATTEFNEKRGDDKGALFGQLWIGQEFPILKAHVFSGEAMKYLNKHILKALEIQDRDEDSQVQSDG